MLPTSRTIFICALTILLVLGAGCATNKPADKYSGFLSDDSKLTSDPDGTGAERYRRDDVDYNKYSKLLIDRILVWYKDDSKYKGIDPTVLKALTDYFYEAIVKECGDEYPVVNEPGPDVMRIRIAITDLVPTQPAASVVVFVTPYAWVGDMAGSEATGSPCVGKATIELEALDSLTNEKLAIYVERKIGDKYNFDLARIGTL